MIRIAAAALALTTICASPALAQHPSVKAAPDSITSALVGTWEGQYQTDHGAGAFTMIIGKDSVWTASLDMVSPDGSGSIPTRMSNFKVSGSNVTWTQELMGMSCKAAAVLAAGTLRGETTCDHGAVSYVLRKK